MKYLKLLILPALGAITLSCSVLPIKAEIKEDHFRFENFKNVESTEIEYAHLMCFKKKPTTWSEPKQYISGEHDLWVKASVTKRHIPESTKETYVNFKVKLDANKSYMLNRKLDNDKIALWIQEVDTGVNVSEVITSELKNPLVFDELLRKRQCKSGTV
ncbi:hypothetical protein [Thalassotalea piscium]|uniref:Uncharacterized protein n=1 Tax=Thalassotalea piscium TaxID=1230533 RepID=A0A7X0NGB6_9GAMM|nr:hypothetical protein [Thalassotalea piscium]MBB6542935.1 hypothetical protein [Thalassotalea piscium]